MKREFHHVGIPTDQVQPGERYSPTFKMYTSGGQGPTRIQYHRFEADSCLHPLIQQLPHVAFKVESLEEAIAGKVLLLSPYEPFKGLRVAITEEGGWPVEYLETKLSEAEIWDDNKHNDSVIYPDELVLSCPLGLDWTRSYSGPR